MDDINHTQDAHHGWCDIKCSRLDQSKLIFNYYFFLISVMPHGHTYTRHNVMFPLFSPQTLPHLTLRFMNCWFMDHIFGSLSFKYTHICRWVVDTEWEKRELIWEDLHVQLDEFSCSIRKLSGCCLKTGWSAKLVVLPALNLCLMSFSPPQQLFTYSDFTGGLLVDCFMPRLFVLFFTSSYTVIILKRPDKLFRSELKASHQTFSRSLLWVLVQRKIH